MYICVVHTVVYKRTDFPASNLLEHVDSVVRSGHIGVNIALRRRKFRVPHDFLDYRRRGFCESKSRRRCMTAGIRRQIAHSGAAQCRMVFIVKIIFVHADDIAAFARDI